MSEMKTGDELAAEFEATQTTTPALWWLGHAGFAIKFANMLFLADPCLGDIRGRRRVLPAPLSAGQITSADLVLATHAHDGHMHGPTLVGLLNASLRAKLVLPKSAAAHAASLGIPLERMTTTDADLRVEFFKEGLYGRVYAVPSAHPQLDRTAVGGYPYLGYLIRFAGYTIYHAGDCVLYEDLAARLKPYNVTIALLPVAGPNFSVQDAAQLAQEIGAQWVVPMHYGTFEGEEGGVTRFIEHMLGQRPEQRFKVFHCGERWIVPEE
jgi:L-ascorbate 6-phosphate lactonase